MSAQNQSDKPPQRGYHVVNFIGVAIALLTWVVPLTAITLTSIVGEVWQPSQNSISGE